MTTPKGAGKVHLETEKIVEKMVQHIDPVMHDFLVIATYVYVGDQIISRGGLKSFDYGNKWHRTLYYKIPVCEYDIWTDPAVKNLLEESLSFAAGETYHFDFVKRPERERPDFLTGTGTYSKESNYDKVVMFSGGLDSFAGALEEIIADNGKVCMVGHYSNNKVYHLQRELYDYLVSLQRTRRKSEPLYIPIEVNKDKSMTREKSQRTRSFLFAVLGAVIAHYEKLSEVTFFENGVVSCNLPWDGQTLQARATRTTHPKFLDLLSLLVSELLQKEFNFINPYFEFTKTDVVERLVKFHHKAKIIDTRSCAEAIYQKPKTHCGLCSQCIDRRFATLAAQCLEHDPWQIYRTNILTDAITATEDRAMAAGFAGFAVKTTAETQNGFFQNLSSELSEIIRHLPDQQAALKSIFSFHQRHARQINQVLGDKIAEYNNHLVNGLLPDTCLLQMVAMKKHLKMSLEKYDKKQMAAEEDVAITGRKASAILGISEGHVSRLKKDGVLKTIGKKLSRNSVLIFKQQRNEKTLEGDLLDLERDAANLGQLH